jgi:hypothetical protein
LQSNRSNKNIKYLFSNFAFSAPRTVQIAVRVHRRVTARQQRRRPHAERDGFSCGNRSRISSKHRLQVALSATLAVGRAV